MLCLICSEAPVFELETVAFARPSGLPEASTNPASGLDSDLYLLGIIVCVSICIYWDRKCVRSVDQVFNFYC